MIPVAKPLFLTRPDEALSRVLDSGWLGQGNDVYEFEQALATYIENDIVVVNTGTTALELAVRNFATSGKEYVVIPDLTFIATAQAVLNAGYKVILCDVDKATLNLCTTGLTKILEAHGDNIAAIINMHYGGMAISKNWFISNCKLFKEWTQLNPFSFIEDAAHSIGSEYIDRESDVRVGSDKDVITCFSFDPIKNITSIEGGALTCPDVLDSNQLRRQRMLGINKDSFNRKNQKRGWEFTVEVPGFRYHMSNVNAVVGLSQLKDITQLKKQRQRALQVYKYVIDKISAEELSSIRFAANGLKEIEKINPFCFTVVVNNRELLADYMKERNIGTTVNWIRLSAYNLPGVMKAKNLECSEFVSKNSLSLPMHAGLSELNLKEISDALLEYRD